MLALVVVVIVVVVSTAVVVATVVSVGQGVLFLVGVVVVVLAEVIVLVGSRLLVMLPLLLNLVLLDGHLLLVPEVGREEFDGLLAVHFKPVGADKIHLVENRVVGTEKPEVLELEKKRERKERFYFFPQNGIRLILYGTLS